jgi:hypothetical protein
MDWIGQLHPSVTETGVFVFHINAIEWGSILFITIEEGKLGEFEGSIH